MTSWRKSSYSSESANCVEVAHVDTEVVVRDSTDPAGPVLTFDAARWREFLAAVKDGELAQ